MNYFKIKNPPLNENKYTKAKTDDLLKLLQQGADCIMTHGMTRLDLISNAIEYANSNGYQVMMLRCDDPSDSGGIMSTCGIFYFKRQPKGTSN